MLLIILLYFLLAEHVSGATMSIIRSSRLQCGNQHCSRELLMMDIVVPETCSTLYEVQ